MCSFVTLVLLGVSFGCFGFEGVPTSSWTTTGSDSQMKGKGVFQRCSPVILAFVVCFYVLLSRLQLAGAARSVRLCLVQDSKTLATSFIRMSPPVVGVLALESGGGRVREATPPAGVDSRVGRTFSSNHVLRD